MTRDQIVELIMLTSKPEVRKQLMQIWFEHTDDLLRKDLNDEVLVQKVIASQVNE